MDEKVKFGKQWRFGEIRFGQRLSDAISDMRDRKHAAENMVEELLAPSRTGPKSGSRITDEMFKDALLAFRPRFPTQSEFADALTTSVETVQTRANQIFGDANGRKGWRNARVWFLREIGKMT